LEDREKFSLPLEKIYKFTGVNKLFGSWFFLALNIVKMSDANVACYQLSTKINDFSRIIQ